MSFLFPSHESLVPGGWVRFWLVPYSLPSRPPRSLLRQSCLPPCCRHLSAHCPRPSPAEALPRRGRGRSHSHSLLGVDPHQVTTTTPAADCHLVAVLSCYPQKTRMRPILCKLPPCPLDWLRNCTGKSSPGPAPPSLRTGLQRQREGPDASSSPSMHRVECGVQEFTMLSWRHTPCYSFILSSLPSGEGGGGGGTGTDRQEKRVREGRITGGLKRETSKREAGAKLSPHGKVDFLHLRKGWGTVRLGLSLFLLSLFRDVWRRGRRRKGGGTGSPSRTDTDTDTDTDSGNKQQTKTQGDG